MQIDFNNPFQGKKWLNLLECENFYMLKFKTNLSYKKSYLGFTFSSNKYGFRGTENNLTDDLILGTSFAMGMSVDNGENWYENINITEPFNLAMPSGIISQKVYYNKLYKGKKKTLIYIYHPNVWQFTKDQISSIESQQNLFALKNWRTDNISAFKMFPKYLMKKIFHFNTIRFNGKKFRLTPNYSFFNTSKLNYKAAETHMKEFEEISSNFKRVLVIRVPVKEQFDVEPNTALVMNYNHWWNYFKSKSKNNIEVYDVSNKFDISYYHTKDTHWNLKGNKLFSSILNTLLNKQ